MRKERFDSRRWHQLGMRELFWLILVVATALFAVLERQERVRQRFELEAEIKQARIVARQARGDAIVAARILDIVVQQIQEAQE